jgi:hypothetical protein
MASFPTTSALPVNSGWDNASSGVTGCELCPAQPAMIITIIVAMSKHRMEVFIT